MFDPNQIRKGAFQYYARLERIKQHIEQNLSDHMSLEEAARIAGMERKYFSAFFHQKVGVCFRHWLMWVRINEAKRRMEARNHSITQIAFTTGFEDLRTFERAFKKCTGITPRDFKRSVQNHDF
jgi:two-component system response regulator YesN